jgi:hypothetical protein
MSWLITRAEAIADPLAARLKAMDRLRMLAELERPEEVVVPILVDAILMAQCYRGARHDITFLADLTRKVDELLKQLDTHEEERDRFPPVLDRPQL